MLRETLPQARAETTFCHELREVLENAFKRVKPSYRGLDTHNNAVMNPKSDHFAAHLLMGSEASRDCRSAGYDFIRFAMNLADRFRP
jgi:hypothetical protein